MAKVSFNKAQMVSDAIRATVAGLFVFFGHPYIGVLIAMIYIEAR